MTTFLLLVAVAATFGLHYVMGRSRWPALGAVVPLALLALVVIAAVQGHMSGLRDWIMAVMSFLVLAVIHGAALDHRAKARSGGSPKTGHADARD